MGIVICFSDKISYKFKVTDLILFLPLLMLVLSGDGKLTANFASNRMNNFIYENKNDENYSLSSKEIVNKNDSEIYFDIIDENYQ